MSTTTQVKKVKLNKMSKARYEQTTPVATELYMLTDVLDPQYDVLPTADAKYAGQITQYTGTTGGGLTNGYFYKCTAQGTTPETYAWEQTDVQPSGGGSSYTAGDGISIDANNEISVTDPVIKNNAPASQIDTSVYVYGDPTVLPLAGSNVAIGKGRTHASTYGVAIGYNSWANQVRSIAIGYNVSAMGDSGIAIGYGADAHSYKAIQLGPGTNSDRDTFKVGNTNGNFEIISADGTIPEARLADTTSATSGQVLKLDSNLNAVWGEAGGGSSYTAGEGIDITSGVISVTNPVVINKANASSGSFIMANGSISGNPDRAIIIQTGSGFAVAGSDAVAFSSSGRASGYRAINIGGFDASASNSIQIGGGVIQASNSDANTFKVANANGNFEMMSADGTIPEARLADTTNAAEGQVLKLDSNLNAVWASGGSGGVSDVTVNGTSVVSGGIATITVPTATSDLTNDSGFTTIDDTSTTSTTDTWSASKLNTTIGNIEALLANI